MEHLSKVMLMESRVKDLEREAAQLCRGQGQDLPVQPVAWRVWLVIFILLVGMIALWIH